MQHSLVALETIAAEGYGFDDMSLADCLFLLRHMDFFQLSRELLRLSLLEKLHIQ